MRPTSALVLTSIIHLMSLQITVGKRQIKCDGIRARKHAILTTASCVVGLGLSKVRIQTELGKQDVQQIIVHPRYLNSSRRSYDLAVLKLAKPLPTNRRRLRARIARKMPKTDTKSFVRDCEGKVMPVKLLSQKECDNQNGYRNPLDVVCAYARKTKDKPQCQPLRGSPLVAGPYLVGIFTGAKEPRKPLRKDGYVLLHTSAVGHRKWIRNALRTANGQKTKMSSEITTQMAPPADLALLSLRRSSQFSEGQPAAEQEVSTTLMTTTEPIPPSVHDEASTVINRQFTADNSLGTEYNKQSTSGHEEISPRGYDYSSGNTVGSSQYVSGGYKSDNTDATDNCSEKIITTDDLPSSSQYMSDTYSSEHTGSSDNYGETRVDLPSTINEYVSSENEGSSEWSRGSSAMFFSSSEDLSSGEYFSVTGSVEATTVTSETVPTDTTSETSTTSTLDVRTETTSETPTTSTEDVRTETTSATSTTNPADVTAATTNAVTRTDYGMSSILYSLGTTAGTTSTDTTSASSSGVTGTPCTQLANATRTPEKPENDDELEVPSDEADELEEDEDEENGENIEESEEKVNEDEEDNDDDDNGGESESDEEDENDETSQEEDEDDEKSEEEDEDDEKSEEEDEESSDEEEDDDEESEEEDEVAESSEENSGWTDEREVLVMAGPGQMLKKMQFGLEDISSQLGMRTYHNQDGTVVFRLPRGNKRGSAVVVFGRQ